MEMFMVKNLGKLYPADQSEAEKMNGIQSDKILKVKVTNTRNYQNHKRFFALMKIVFENQDKYPSLEQMRKEIIMRTGRYVAHHHLTGAVSYSAESIAFDKMDESEFNQLFSDTIDVALKYFCKNMTEEQLWEVARFG